MKLLLFLVGEFLHMVTAAILIVILFLGGWHFPWLTGAEHEVTGWGTQSTGLMWLQSFVRVAVLCTKTLLVIVFFMLVRWSWPRFRFDQLMALAWKVMLPLGLINLVAVAVFNEIQMIYPNGELKIVLIAISWAICIGAWVAITMLGPTVADNKPRDEVREGVE